MQSPSGIWGIAESPGASYKEIKVNPSALGRVHFLVKQAQPGRSGNQKSSFLHLHPRKVLASGRGVPCPLFYVQGAPIKTNRPASIRFIGENTDQPLCINCALVVRATGAMWKIKKWRSWAYHAAPGLELYCER
jgi:hypothetical protein